MSRTGWNQKPKVEMSEQGMTVNGQGAGLAKKEAWRSLSGLIKPSQGHLHHGLAQE